MIKIEEGDELSESLSRKAAPPSLPAARNGDAQAPMIAISNVERGNEKDFGHMILPLANLSDD
jgi:hypothetical protein